jgi:hypothetical protein
MFKAKQATTTTETKTTIIFSAVLIWLPNIKPLRALMPVNINVAVPTSPINGICIGFSKQDYTFLLYLKFSWKTRQTSKSL